MPIIAILGMPGSGKTVLSSYLEDKGYPVIRFGSFIVEEVRKRGLVVNPENETLVRVQIRRELGMNAVAQLALPWIEEKHRTSGIVIIEGVYSYSEYKTLINRFPNEFITVAVVASKKIRYDRLRNRNERPLTREEAEERDRKEVDQIEKAQPIALADFFLLNEGDETSFLSSAQVLLDKLIGITPQFDQSNLSE